MKTTSIIVALALALLLAPLAIFAQSSSDETEIKDVIRSAYIDGVFRLRDPEMMKAGFAEIFVMQVYWDGELSSRTRDQWLERMKLDGTPNEDDWTGKVSVLEVTGVAAVARIDLSKNGAPQYTDYFSLYKTSDAGWQIVSKIFHGHGH